MESLGNAYDKQINNFDRTEKEAKIAKEVYISRRKVWASTLWSLLSFIAPYIYTRRWKPLGGLVGSLFVLGCFIGDSEDIEASFRKGQELAPIFMVLAAIDNGIAIKKYQRKVKEKSSNMILEDKAQLTDRDSQPET